MDLLCECWSHNSVHTLMRSPCSVKLSALWFNFILLTSQQVSLSVSHRCWKKTRDSWVREKELYYSQHSTKRMSIRMSASIPLVSKFHTGEWRGPERCHMCSGFVLQLGNSKLGEPTAFLASSKLSLSFIPEGDVTSSLKTAHCKPNHEKWLAYSGVVERLQDSP